MNDHTPEPYYANGLAIIAEYTDKDGNHHRCHVADVTNRNEINREPSLEEYATARRIVACVNICTGIPTEILEDIGPGGFYKATNRR